ncbi:hypothetical protein DL766_009219 [Monosporascus sp. MC13-8B]|uniref:Alpha and gamma adaptin binding protein p34 n=1 Tax=Monosporascus cannonballus TaxID=155416 RepID=A0ABY0GZS6_9PEZI|nr:hypothetical protein DL762_008746 [Monosporascus cannonballus]RYO97003.1 hypothetical protein DL763_002940 [Monosporascus cannonballus]RYP16139.1 hypothetical protein DL766_009219 [Monosporascus sp. MC13-8B]
MDITNPRRILAVSSVDATQHLIRVIKDLTGTTPEPASSSLAGTTHNLPIKTAYYAATVPVWLDLIASPSEWAGSFLSAEAKEVLDVLGGVVVVFPLPVQPKSDEGDAARELIRGVGRVLREGLGGWEWDGVGLCLGVGEVDDVDDWEDCCAEWGLEFVQVRSQAVPGRNEFGEKTGIPRVLEALEANDWSLISADDMGSEFGEFEGESRAGKDTSGPNPGGERDDGPDLDPETLEFGFDREDFVGLRRAIWSSGGEEDDGDNEEQDSANGEPSAKKVAADGGPPPGGGSDEKVGDEEVRKLERMMIKLQAARDMGAGLPEDQRRRMAAKAVGEVMKEL